MLGGSARVVTKEETECANWSSVAAYNLISSTEWVMVAGTNRICSDEEAVNSVEGANTTVKIRGEVLEGIKMC